MTVAPKPTPWTVDCFSVRVNHLCIYHFLFSRTLVDNRLSAGASYWRFRKQEGTQGPVDNYFDSVNLPHILSILSRSVREVNFKLIFSCQAVSVIDWRTPETIHIARCLIAQLLQGSTGVILISFFLFFLLLLFFFSFLFRIAWSLNKTRKQF